MDPKENALRAILHDHPDHVPYWGWGNRECEPLFVHLPPPFPACRDRFERERIDPWGVTWGPSSCTGAYPVAHPLRTLEDLQGYAFPDPAESGISDLDERIRDIKRTSFALADPGATIFDVGTMLLGTERNLMLMLDAPDAMRGFFSRVCEYQLKIASHYIDAGVDMVKLCDDYGTQRALQISPDMWRTFIKLPLARIVDRYKKSGVLVMLHSCGRIMDIFADLVDIGIDIWDPSQSGANDLAMLKKAYGDRVTFSGGLDSHIMVTGTESDIRTIVLNAIRTLAPGGGYICSPEQPLPVPEQHYRIFAQTVREHGRYPVGKEP